MHPGLAHGLPDLDQALEGCQPHAALVPVTGSQLDLQGITQHGSWRDCLQCTPCGLAAVGSAQQLTVHLVALLTAQQATQTLTWMCAAAGQLPASRAPHSCSSFCSTWGATWPSLSFQNSVPMRRLLSSISRFLAAGREQQQQEERQQQKKVRQLAPRPPATD